MGVSKQNMRKKILGMGQNSLSKSYYRPFRESVDNLKRYKSLLDQANDAICLLSLPKLDFIDTNQSAKDLFGLTDFVPGAQNLFDKVGNSCHDKIDEWLNTYNEDGSYQAFKISFEYFSPKLGARVVELNLSEVTFAENKYAVCVIHDITDYRKTLAALSQSEENLRITLNSIGDAVIATDRNGIITRMNTIAANLTGWNVEEAVGNTLDDVFKIINSETDQQQENPVNRVLDSGKIVGLANHSLLISRNGEAHHIADSGAPIRDDNDEIVGVVLVFRDVTLEHELEEKLFQAQKMESVGQLAGGIAHDFNNMLTGILASADLLKKRLQETDSSDRLLNVIIDSANRAANLTQKLLAFARKGKLISKPTCIHKSIRNAVSLLERSIDKRIEIVLDLSAEFTQVSGDPNQLINIFLNLGVNSRDAMPEGGQIFIRTTNVFISENHLISHLDLKPGNYLEIQFSDTGGGIPDEIKNKIFDPFFTTKKVGDGTGMGLAAVYGTVKDHGGAIELDSIPDTGTTFNIYLPLETDECKPKKQDMSSTGEFRELAGCILIIDDEEIIRETASEILEELGYQVLCARDGQEGLDIYRENQELINVIILDMIMPKMNGRECFAQLRKINPEIKVLISSGFTSEEAMRNINIDDAAGFLKKPFTVTELYEALCRVIED